MQAVEALADGDTKTRLESLAALNAALEGSQFELSGWADAVDALVPCLSDNNFRVALGALNALDLIAAGVGAGVRSRTPAVLSSLVERMGDGKAPVREQATLVALAWAEAVGAAACLNRVAAAFAHKNWRVREQIALLVRGVLASGGSAGDVPESAGVRPLLRLLGDSHGEVRDAALDALVELRRVTGPALVPRIEAAGASARQMRALLEAFAPTTTSGEEEEEAGAGAGAQAREAFHGDVSRELTGLEAKLNAEDDWKGRMDALGRLSALARTSAAHDAAFVPGLVRMRDTLENQLTDLRSAIVREACALVGVLAAELGQALEPLADGLVATLLRQTAITISVISTSAKQALRDVLFCTRGGFVRVLARLEEGAAARSPPVRVEATTMLMVAVRLWDGGVLQRRGSALMETARAALADAQSEVRSAGRQLYWALAEAFPGAAESLMARLDTQAQRHLTSSSTGGAVSVESYRWVGAARRTSREAPPPSREAPAPAREAPAPAREAPAPAREAPAPAPARRAPAPARREPRGHARTTSAPAVPQETQEPDVPQETQEQQQPRPRTTGWHRRVQSIPQPARRVAATGSLRAQRVPTTPQPQQRGEPQARVSVRRPGGIGSGIGGGALRVQTAGADRAGPPVRAPGSPRQASSSLRSPPRAGAQRVSLSVGDMREQLSAPTEAGGSPSARGRRKRSGAQQGPSLAAVLRDAESSTWSTRVAAFEQLKAVVETPARHGDVAAQMGRIARALADHLGESHHKVVQAALAALAPLFARFAEALDAQLQWLLPGLFCRLTDSRPATQQLANAALTEASAQFASPALLSVLVARVMDQPSPAVRLGCVEFMLHLVPTADAYLSQGGAMRQVLAKTAGLLQPHGSRTAADLHRAAVALLEALLNAQRDVFLAQVGALPSALQTAVRTTLAGSLAGPSSSSSVVQPPPAPPATAPAPGDVAELLQTLSPAAAVGPADRHLGWMRLGQAARSGRARGAQVGQVVVVALSGAADADPTVRQLALSVLCAVSAELSDYLDVALARLLECERDPVREVCHAAESAVEELLRRVDGERCLVAALPLVASEDAPTKLGALRLLPHVVPRIQSSALMRRLPALMPQLRADFESPSADVRKAVVFALVALYVQLRDAFKPHLQQLTAAQQKLVTIYINRALSSAG